MFAWIIGLGGQLAGGLRDEPHSVAPVLALDQEQEDRFQASVAEADPDLRSTVSRALDNSSVHVRAWVSKTEGANGREPERAVITVVMGAGASPRRWTGS